jgi:hypothetical protein
MESPIEIIRMRLKLPKNCFEFYLEINEELDEVFKTI